MSKQGTSIVTSFKSPDNRTKGRGRPRYRNQPPTRRHFDKQKRLYAYGG